jgi:hypothetical protein
MSQSSQSTKLFLQSSEFGLSQDLIWSRVGLIIFWGGMKQFFLYYFSTTQASRCENHIIFAKHFKRKEVEK